MRMRVLGMLLVFSCGCASLNPPPDQPRPATERQETVSALQSVGQAVSGRQLTEEDLAAVARQMQSDEDARQAVETITESLSGGAAKVKYCPICGRRYSPHMKTCPVHGVELKELTE